MRHRILRTWFVALLGTLLLWSAASLVFSLITVGGGASPVQAAPEDELEPKAADSGEKSGVAATEAENDADAKTEKAADDKTPSEKDPAAKDAEKNADAKDADAKGADAKGADAKDADPKDKDAVKDDGEKADPKEADEKEKAPAKPAAAAGTGDKTAGKSKDASSKDNFLVWLYHSLKLRYVTVFLIITFNSVALIVMIVLGARRSSICPDDLVLEFETKLNEKQYQEAYEMLKGDKTFLGRVLMAGMSKLSDGYEAALESMREVGEEQNMKLEQRNGYTALIAQVAPMFGLLGTVDGMVMAFDVIANSNVTPKPSELAQGIGTALVTTLVGLWISIPMLVFYNIVRNRLSRMVFETGVISETLMKRFSTIRPDIKKT